MCTIEWRNYPQPRIRHHTNPQVYLPRARLRVVPPCYPPLIEYIDWGEVFGNAAAPTLLDIGCGMGRFILEYAVNHPSENVVGLEVRKPAADWISNVITGEGIRNAAVFWYSVANGLGFLDSGSLQAVTYFFPDPWFKKRHAKRRAFTLALVEEIWRVLSDDGTLFLMTDVPEVDRYQRDILLQHGGFTIEEVTSDDRWFVERTNQELFCRSKGIPYVRLRCAKR